MNKGHETIFHHLRNIISKNFKRNVDRNFVCYMVDTYSTSMGVWHGESRK